MPAKFQIAPGMRFISKIHDASCPSLMQVSAVKDRAIYYFPVWDDGTANEHLGCEGFYTPISMFYGEAFDRFA